MTELAFELTVSDEMAEGRIGVILYGDKNKDALAVASIGWNGRIGRKVPSLDTPGTWQQGRRPRENRRTVG